MIAPLRPSGSEKTPENRTKVKYIFALPKVLSIQRSVWNVQHYVCQLSNHSCFEYKIVENAVPLLHGLAF